MRKSLILKCVLLSVLFNGAAVATAQAANLAHEISRIGNSCEESVSMLELRMTFEVLGNGECRERLR